jgi:deazaflavin-dependent oxidoreductase (nitroreductase family)
MRAPGPPPFVPIFNAIAKPLLAAGVPFGFNRLVTIRGRKSGQPRTTPLAVIEVAGRRWVWAPWGEVQWVRNLRAAGRATITVTRVADQVDLNHPGEAAKGRPVFELHAIPVPPGPELPSVPNLQGGSQGAPGPQAPGSRRISAVLY